METDSLSAKEINGLTSLTSYSKIFMGNWAVARCGAERYQREESPGFKGQDNG